MALVVTERVESRRGEVGLNPWEELLYTVEGTQDDVEARNEVLAASPTGYDVWGSGLLVLPRQGVSNPQPLGDTGWFCTVRYGRYCGTGDTSYQWSTLGGTQHITHSRATVASYPSGAPDFGQAINYTPGGIGGVDITVPVRHVSITKYFTDVQMSGSYSAIVDGLTGRVNDASFQGRAKGEVFFLGADASRRGYGDWEVQFSFAVLPNETGLSVGDITGIDKEGWQYLWVFSRWQEDDAGDPKYLIEAPVAVYIEKIFDYGDFSWLGLKGAGPE